MSGGPDLQRFDCPAIDPDLFGRKPFLRQQKGKSVGRPRRYRRREETYGLALLLTEQGFSPRRPNGWTVEPLEVWSATYRSFPHDRHREALLRRATSKLIEQGFQSRIHFRCIDLTQVTINSTLPKEEAVSVCQFDLILCNGLLGGPIIHEKEQLEQVVGNLVQLLAPGGILLAADNFHGGWKQKCPQAELRASFETYGLEYVETGEGIGGLKPD